MKIEKKEDRDWQESGSLYIAMDENFSTYHISMKGKGKEGLVEFMQEDVERALKGKDMPSG